MTYPGGLTEAEYQRYQHLKVARLDLRAECIPADATHVATCPGGHKYFVRQGRDATWWICRSPQYGAGYAGCSLYPKDVVFEELATMSPILRDAELASVPEFSLDLPFPLQSAENALLWIHEQGARLDSHLCEEASYEEVLGVLREFGPDEIQPIVGILSVYLKRRGS